MNPQAHAWQYAHIAAMAQASNAIAIANAEAAASAAAASSTRAALVGTLQTHLAALAPALAANPDALGHLAAAQSVAAQLAV